MVIGPLCRRWPSLTLLPVACGKRFPGPCVPSAKSPQVAGSRLGKRLPQERDHTSPMRFTYGGRVSPDLGRNGVDDTGAGNAVGGGVALDGGGLDGTVPDQPPTIYDVARVAGLSIASVSRVLNGRRNPRPETRDRVLQAVAELGFVPDSAARAL